jgi:hypothetical protein
LPGGGRYQIRAAIRDENSSEIGSAYQYVDVPDFNEPRITLSSIDLSSARDDRNSERTTWNGYALGSPLRFRCGVFGFRTANASPHAAQVILFRETDRRPLSDTGTMPVPAATLENHYLAGQLDIASLLVAVLLHCMDAGGARRSVDAPTGRADIVCSFVFVDQFTQSVAGVFRALRLHREGFDQI